MVSQLNTTIPIVPYLREIWQSSKFFMEIFNYYFHENVKSPAVSQKHSLSFKTYIYPKSGG